MGLGFFVYIVLVAGLGWMVLQRPHGLLWSLALLIVAFALPFPLSQALPGEPDAWRVFGVPRMWAWFLFVESPVVLGLLARRWGRSRGGLLSGIAGAVLLGVGVWSHVVEPRMLEVTRHEIPSTKVTEPLRIVLLSDIQTDDVGRFEQRVLDRVAAKEPDLVLLTGDYVQVYDRAGFQKEARALRALWSPRITPPLGSWAVPGNVEQVFPDENPFQGTDVRYFFESGTAEVGPVALTALDLADSFDSNLVVPGHDRFHIAFGHGPDFSMGAIDADLLLAGHTHGGQVQLPFIGPLVTLSGVPRDQAHGRTDRPDGSALIVSRGIGMERGDAPRLRFLCPPEIVVIDVVPAQ